MIEDTAIMSNNISKAVPACALGPCGRSRVRRGKGKGNGKGEGARALRVVSELETRSAAGVCGAVKLYSAPLLKGYTL